MVILVGVELLHSLGDVFGIELFTDDAEEGLELVGVDSAVAVLVEGVEAFLERGQLLLGEVVVGGLDQEGEMMVIS